MELLPNFLVTPFRELKAFFVCRRGHPLLSRFFFLTLRDVLDYPLVMTKLPRRTLDSIALELGFAEQPDWIRELPLIKCDHPHISMEIVALSDAVGVILLPMIEQELITGQFVLLPVSFPEFKTHAGIVRLKNRTPSRRWKSLLTYFWKLTKRSLRPSRISNRSSLKRGITLPLLHKTQRGDMEPKKITQGRGRGQADFLMNYPRQGGRGVSFPRSFFRMPCYHEWQRCNMAEKPSTPKRRILTGYSCSRKRPQGSNCKNQSC